MAFFNFFTSLLRTINLSQIIFLSISQGIYARSKFFKTESKIQIFHIPMFEEKSNPQNTHFDKVQEKLGQLITSKLQNISQQSLKSVQERINTIQKKLMDEISTNQVTAREYRLKLRSYQEQNWENEQKYRTALKDRSSQISMLKQQIVKIMQKENEDRFQKDIWGQSSTQKKIDKIEKEGQRVRQDRKQDIQDSHTKITREITCNQASIRAGTHVLDKVFLTKEENVRAISAQLREAVEAEEVAGVKRERDVMENIKGVVSEAKGAVASEKRAREENQQRLRIMLQEATRNLASSTDK